MPRPSSTYRRVSRLRALAATPGAAALAGGILLRDSGGLARICVLALALPVALALTAVAVLLLRAALGVNGRGFERVVFLLRLILRDIPVSLSQRSSRETESAVCATMAESPPPRARSRMPHCPECLLHGTDRTHD